jgi:hypothetical protein
MPRLVCGTADTVRTHIIPRSLFRLTRGEQRMVARTRRGDTGWEVSQSGFYDDNILCSAHEECLGRFDDYAFRFCKGFRAQAAQGAISVTLRNDRPELLVGFACAVVWRMAASRSASDPEEMLGPFATRLRDLLFEETPFDPLLLLSRNAFHLGGKLLDMNVLPVPYDELGLHFCRFITCGIVFDLKLDERPAPAPMAVLAANDQREITLIEDLPQDALRTPGLGEALIRFAQPRQPFRRE